MKLILKAKDFLKNLKRSTASTAYMPEVDGVRFLAISIVTLYHLNNFFLAKSPYNFDVSNNLVNIFLQNGFKGVQVFFVLSGFILALPFAKYFFKQEKKPSLKKYYLRRLSRIEPPYFIALSLFFLLYVAKGQFSGSDLLPGLFLNFFYVHNIFYVSGPSILGVLLWTLEIEVQFYLIAPVLAQIFRLNKIIRRSLLILLIFLLPMLNLVFVTSFIWLFNYLYYFLIGFLIADLYINENGLKFVPPVSFLIGVLSFFIFTFIDIDNFVYKYIFIGVLFVVFYLILVDNFWKNILGKKAIATIGGMCYSIYLVHTVVISGFGNTTVFWLFTSDYLTNLFFQFLFLLPPIIIIGTLFYLFFERPFMDKNWPIKFYFKVKNYFRNLLNFFYLKFMNNKTALVCGAGGFIGSHLVKKLKKEGFWVRGVDLKKPEYSATGADDFIVGDLRDQSVVENILDIPFDEVYQLAADMGGAGYIFSGEHDADVMHNSATINLNIVDRARRMGVKKIFYSSSACIYPEYNQLDKDNPKCSEVSAYPAAPDSEYGWEKLFSERLYLSYFRNYGLQVRIARFHNIFGPEGAWNNGKEKSPAAICRKVAESPDSGTIEIWGDGEQTRSFLYIDECLEGVRRLMDSDFIGPVNIGSEEMISINNLAYLAMDIAGKKLNIKHIDGPLGVRGRNSDNNLIQEKLGWKPSRPLKDGLAQLYKWINEQIKSKA